MILYNIGEVTDRTIHYFSYYSPRPKNDIRLFIAPIFAHSLSRFTRSLPLFHSFLTIGLNLFLSLASSFRFFLTNRQDPRASLSSVNFLSPSLILSFSLSLFLSFSLSLSLSLSLSFSLFLDPVPLARAFVDSSHD